jgi:Tol biopolymer transport system component
VYIVDVAELIPRKLVTNISGMFQPSWSHDGKWIYFLSGSIVAPPVHRCPTKGRNADVLSSEPAFGVHEAFDGETLYFVDRWSDATLKKVSVKQTGPASQVAGMPLLKDAALWAVVPQGIYFVAADAPRAICYFDFATKQVRRIIDVDGDLNSRNGGLSVSPDGRWILYSQVDDVSSDVMLVEHFR